MTVKSVISELDSTRTYTDVIIRSALGSDLQSVANAQYEMITDVAAPGSSVRAIRGHTHDSSGNGRGIMRGVCGRFYCVDTLPLGPPLNLSKNTVATVSAASGETSNYIASGASNYVMGVAFVSPGIDDIRVETCWKVDTLLNSPAFRIKNLTDSTTTEWLDIDSTDPKWYWAELLGDPTDANLGVTRTAVNRPQQRRIELDIEVKLGAAFATEFYLYCAFPYEFESAAS